MPKLEEALYAHLTGDPVVTGLVAQRVYLAVLPERTTLPAIVFRRIDATRLYTHDPYPDTDAWAQVRVQFDCWGRSALEAIEVGEAILLALSGYDGELGGTLTVGSSFAVDEVDLYESATKFFRRVVDFRISYEDDVDTEEEPGVDAVAEPGTVGGVGA